MTERVERVERVPRVERVERAARAKRRPISSDVGRLDHRAMVGR